MPSAAIGYTVICALVGLFSILYGLYQRRRLSASRDWNQVVGRIAAASVVEEKGSEGVQYRALVRFEYLVDRQNYSSARIEFSNRAYIRKKSAQAQVDRYPIGSEVIVYVDPEKPEDAVLNRSASNAFGYIAGGILAIAFAIALVAFSLAQNP